MIPILFPADAATYTTQGLGALSDAISCKVREERNGEFELEMKYPQAGLHFPEIADRCIILAIPSPWRAAQPFRIYRITKPLNGVCTIYARHITYDLSGIPVNVFSATSAAGALSGLKTNSATANPFEFWTDKQTAAAFAVSVPASIRSLLGGRTGSVLDVYGGEYEWDGWTVRLHEHRGTDRGVTIRYGKNLTDIEQDRNIANVRTGLYPYWADNDGNLVVCDPPIVNAPGSYDFINIQTVDFSQEWQEAPTPAQLKARAEQYIQANEIGVPIVSISVSFVDLSRTDQYKDLALLEQCDLCDIVTVQFEELGIDATAEVVSIETDVLLERYDKIGVGSLRTNIADTIVDNKQRTDEQVKQTTSYLEDRIQQSTDLITNGGGYIYRKFDAAKNWVEIGSTDNLDLSKAIHVWRWNNGGFGHSGNGYNGPYRTAITQDGHIVANFIDVGTLTANIIRAGILQDVAGKAFYLDLPNGVLRMNATELSISGAPAASQSYAQQQAQAAQQAAIQAAAQSLSDYAETVTASLDDLQQQVDGQITTYFYDYKPANDNAPANEWTTVEEMRRHAGDLFYNTSNGDAYRWAQSYGTWQWLEIVDTDVAAALAAAAAAQDTADSKRRVFTTQPVPPYDAGDLWAEENNGPLQVCVTAKASGAAFAAADWTEAANYTAQAAVAGRNIILNSQYMGNTSSLSNIENDDGTIVISFAEGENNQARSWPRNISEYGLDRLRGAEVTVSYDYQITEAIEYASGASGTPGAIGRLEITFTDGSKQYIGAPSNALDSLGTAVMPAFARVSASGVVYDKEISSVRFNFYGQYFTGEIKYRNPKVELGAFATPWSPAPEDTAIAAEAPALDQLGTFNKLTNNGQLQGIYMSGGQLYINGSYIRAGTIDASQVNVTNLNADNIKSGTITGRAISGGTITGTTITGSSVRSTSNSGSVLVYQGHVSLYDPSGNTLLDIVPGGNNSPANLNFFLPGFGNVGSISCQNDNGLGRIIVTCGNNGFFTTNRIQTQEIACSNGSGIYSNSYKFTPGNKNFGWVESDGGRVVSFDKVNLGTTGATWKVDWVWVADIGRYCLATVT